MNERQLIARVIAGDRLAGRALYDTHAPRVYSLAYRLTGDADKAKDSCKKAAEFNSLPAIQYAFIRTKAAKA